MHETTFNEAWVDPIILLLSVILGLCLVPAGFWFHYIMKKDEPGAPDNFTFKSYLKGLLKSIVCDTWEALWGLLKLALWILIPILGISIVYMVFRGIAAIPVSVAIIIGALIIGAAISNSR